MMVSQNLYGVFTTFQIVPPVLKGFHNGQHLLIRRPVIQFRTLELSGVVSGESIRRIDSIDKTNTGSSRGCKGHRGLYTNSGQKRTAPPGRCRDRTNPLVDTMTLGSPFLSPLPPGALAACHLFSVLASLFGFPGHTVFRGLQLTSAGCRLVWVTLMELPS